MNFHPLYYVTVSLIHPSIDLDPPPPSTTCPVLTIDCHSIHILSCQCQTDMVAEADQWSVWKGELGFSKDMLGGGRGSCVGVRQSSHGADLSNYNSTTPSRNVWSICHHKGREYGEHEREENVKGMATQPDTGSVNAASESSASLNILL